MQAAPVQDGRPSTRPVTTRDELIYLLSIAAELEHGLSCVYLFAAFSLKDDAAEGGLTGEQLALVRSWKRTLSTVAVGEMMHLAQVCNLLTAIGGAPHLRRPNFPQPPSAYPLALAFTLAPVSLRTLERLVCYELPTDLPSAAREIFDPIRARLARENATDAPRDAAPGVGADGIEPYVPGFATVGELYRTIEAAFSTLPEAELFIGPRRAQTSVGQHDFRKDLIEVVDRASARAAIERIVKEGEAAPSEAPDGHFMVFDRMRRMFEAEAARDPRFEPARPVVTDPTTRRYIETRNGSLIVAPTTHAVAELFNLAYETMLLMLLRFFACTDETEAELDQLARDSVVLMSRVLAPLGESLTKMPFGGSANAGRTAGPSFGFTREVHLLPHRRAAWIVIHERLERLATTADALGRTPGVPVETARVAETLSLLADGFKSAVDHPPSAVKRFDS